MDFPELARESQEIWEQNARWWDARMAEGDRWHTHLIVPAIERLLALQSGERVWTSAAVTDGWPAAWRGRARACSGAISARRIWNAPGRAPRPMRKSIIGSWICRIGSNSQASAGRSS